MRTPQQRSVPLRRLQPARPSVPPPQILKYFARRPGKQNHSTVNKFELNSPSATGRSG